MTKITWFWLLLALLLVVKLCRASDDGGDSGDDSGGDSGGDSEDSKSEDSSHSRASDDEPSESSDGKSSDEFGDNSYDSKSHSHSEESHSESESDSRVHISSLNPVVTSVTTYQSPYYYYPYYGYYGPGWYSPYYYGSYNGYGSGGGSGGGGGGNSKITYYSGTPVVIDDVHFFSFTPNKTCKSKSSFTRNTLTVNVALMNITVTEEDNNVTNGDSFELSLSAAGASITPSIKNQGANNIYVARAVNSIVADSTLIAGTSTDWNQDCAKLKGDTLAFLFFLNSTSLYVVEYAYAPSQTLLLSYSLVFAFDDTYIKNQAAQQGYNLTGSYNISINAMQFSVDMSSISVKSSKAITAFPLLFLIAILFSLIILQ